MKKIIGLFLLVLSNNCLFARDIYVDVNQPSDDLDGLSWIFAKKTIQSAVNCAQNGDIIWVTNGVYDAFSVTNVTSLSLVGVNGAEKTIIDGKLVKRCAKLPELTSTGVVSVSGFTLCNGRSTGSGSAGRGGGVYGGELYSCVISNNVAGIGGGTYNSALHSCLVAHNAAQTGGGVYGKTAENSTIVDNVADLLAGGVSSCSVTSSLIWNNYAGDGLENYDGMSTIQYSCVSPADGLGCEDLIPLFVDEGTDYRLLYGSPTFRGYDSNAYTIVTLDPENNVDGIQRDVMCYAYSQLPVPTRAGDFGFAGWWTTNGIEVFSDMPLIWQEAHTLRARWVYTVHNAFQKWGYSWNSGGDVIWKSSNAVGLYGHPVLESGNANNTYQESWIEAAGLTGCMVRVYWKPIQTNEYWSSDYPLITINNDATNPMYPNLSQDGFSSGWNVYEEFLNPNGENRIKITSVGNHAIQVALVSVSVPVNVYSRSYDPIVYYFYQGTPYVSNEAFASINSQSGYWYSDSLIGWSTNVVGQQSLINPWDLVALKSNASLYGQYVYWPDVNLVLGTENLPWQSGGESPWSVDNATLFSGVAMGSGYLMDNQSSWLETSVSGPCVVRFMWKVSSEGGYDWLSFSVDGIRMQAISGDKNNFSPSGSSSYLQWQQVKIIVPAGHHQLRWTYAKDSSTAVGSDCGWIDDVHVGPVNYATFDAQGGTVYPAKIALGDGVSVGVLPTPQRDGYVFQGWWTSPDQGQQIFPSTIWSGSESPVFYAKWTSAAMWTLGDWSYGAYMFQTWKTNQLEKVVLSASQTLAVDPNSCEAHILRAVASVANLAENDVLHALLSRFGYVFDFPIMEFFGVYTPECVPPTNEMIDQVAQEVVPIIDSALADLDYIPDAWNDMVLVSSSVYPVDSDVYIDYADVLFFRAMLHTLKTAIAFAQAYDATLNYASFDVKNRRVPMHEIRIDGLFDDWKNVPVDCDESRNNRIVVTKVAYGVTNVSVFAQIAEGIEWTYLYCGVASRNYFVSLQCNVNASSLVEGEVYSVQGYLHNVFSPWNTQYFDVRICRKGNAIELMFPVPDGYAADTLTTISLNVNYLENGYGMYDFSSTKKPSELASYWLNANSNCAYSIRNVNALASSKASLRSALNNVLAADDAVQTRTDSRLHFFEYDLTDAERETAHEKTRVTISNIRVSMDQPVNFNTNSILEEAVGVALTNSAWQIKVGALFDAPYVVRGLFPRVTEHDAVFIDSLKDTTFSGALPGFDLSIWNTLLASKVHAAKEVKDNSAQMTLDKNTAMWLEWPVVGTGTVVYCVSIANASDTASLSTYIDGQKSSRICFGSEVVTQTVHFAENGDHALQWKFSSQYCEPFAAATIQILEVNGLQGISENVSVSIATDTGVKSVEIPRNWFSEMYPATPLYSLNDYRNLAQSVGVNGHSVWLSYVLGLSPTNNQSKFIATIHVDENGKPVVSYSPQGSERIPNVQYRVMGKTNLDDSQWEQQRDGHHFFKVEVVIP